MQSQTLAAEIRSKVGKQSAQKLRREGRLPGILYGKEAGNVPIYVSAKELEGILDREGDNALIKLITEGDEQKEFFTVVREVQRHPYRNQLIHADFYQVSLKEKIKSTVPVVLEGEAKGVKEGGILQHGAREIEVESLPVHLPESITVDISNLGLGENLTVGDINLPGEVKIITEPNVVIATILSNRGTAKKEEPEEETETLTEDAE
ncbi:MAG: large subunit ribosomal protein [Clostridia bacterium]|nr:large subunit ribosomal protein [Clostridia bacterium]